MTPWDPSKYASRRRARNPFSPMMSQTIMSSVAGAPFQTTSTDFFVTFLLYVSVDHRDLRSFPTRRSSDLLPTATSPTRQTLALRCFWPAIVDVAIMGHPSSAVLCTVQTRVSPLIILTLQGALFARTAPSRPARQGTGTHSRR